MSKRKRIRAHANPLADSEIPHPATPKDVLWDTFYPEHKQALADLKTEVKFADVGCGFGGLLVSLAPVFPDKLILGLEIRDRVVTLDKERIVKLRKTKGESESGAPIHSYNNIWVERTNIMKYAANYFRKGQLEKMFFCFPDPHFKKANFRRRVINPNFLAIYAYILQPGGLLYTITDVKALHEWMVKHLEEHPLFERLTEEELALDPCLPLITSGTEEGMKVTRCKGNKWPAVFRRVTSKSSLPSSPSS
jgi:tRNA (guanine-N7-)-methyltransferase